MYPPVIFPRILDLVIYTRIAIEINSIKRYPKGIRRVNEGILLRIDCCYERYKESDHNEE